MIKDDRVKEDPTRRLFNMAERDQSDKVETPYWMQVAQAQAVAQAQEEAERRARQQEKMRR